ncbi:D-alanine--D-alanine ligase [Spirabiliibacterium falconis]|uniref:D-alanine--D-alanine ligase n=1 Tax=Spirabiliibacterium falconis TaxID=572023 RepID=UPI001AAC95B1|nr:D-alanine--D-alanine ligase [Spirabiliibacterium falconis]MBE2895041.1 D-alanine--D-alanine ligase [Spirabiliibacterium falconis]
MNNKSKTMKALEQQKIAVLYGGTSEEREVSLASGSAIIAALREEGLDAHGVDPKTYPIVNLKQDGFDRVFNILHGRGGEDGTVQGLLENLGIPYTGCGVLASSLSMDKLRTKLLWRGLGLPIADMEVVTRNSIHELDADAVVARLGLPLMVKPSLEGSSVGLTKVDRIEQLKSAVEYALEFDQTVLIEEWLSGAEYSVPVLGDEVLPAVKIVPQGAFYDYEAKYLSDTTQYFCPAGLSDERECEIRALVKRAYDSIGCRGWGRIDVMEDSKGQFRLIEANTNPGMTSHSLFPMSAKVHGYTFGQLVVKILQLSE